MARVDGRIEFDAAKIPEICRRHNIARLALFGSVIHKDFRPESDVDALVEFEQGNTPGLEFFEIQAELSAACGRMVDLNTKQDLSPYFRDEVLGEAVVIYDKKE
ncbi:MAG: nucleotidyltransferase family protein [Nitrospinae bacterium]|nr:nucleotidyltransferase family protein [Nitrospinota bacterium]